MLFAGLITVLSTAAFAESTNHSNTIKAKPLKTQVKKGVKAVKSSPKLVKAKQQKVVVNSAKTQVASKPILPAYALTASAAQAPTSASQPTTTTNPSSTSGTQAPNSNTTAPAPAAAVRSAQPLDCNYKIPAETTRIEQTIVSKWAEKAAEQSFDFDYKSIDEQILKLKACFTDQGWQSFNDALEKSGNLNAIKAQQLTVNSMVNGETKVTELKDNQWKITIPMQVVYQNDKEKLTQPLIVDVIVGRKVSGDLGIMQMIAVPRQTRPAAKTSTESMGS
ncbi:MAG: DotI/IcmL/TraM family protein [Tatlockia sp.]|nr:DotI/IcmL/TraM family protein [Tatlockia sp.]